MVELIRWSGVPSAAQASRARLWQGLCLVLAAWALTLATTARAAAPQDMPSVEQVMAAAGGRDALDTAARQRAALLQAAGVVETLSDGRVYRNQLTAQERASLSAYKSRAREIERQTLAGFDPAQTRQLGLNSPRAQWFRLATRLELDAKFRAEVVEPLLTPAQREQLRQLPLVQEQRQRQLAAAQQQAQQQRRQALEAAEQAEARKLNQLTRRIAWMTALPLLAVAGLALLSPPPGIRARSNEPNAFLGGRRAVEFQVVRGRVSGLAERSDTYVSGGGGSTGPDRPVSVSISSTVRVTQKFFLQREDSSELLPVTLTDADIPLANGHRLGLIWAARPNGKDSILALVVNHEAQCWWQLAKGPGLVFRFRLSRNWVMPWLVVQVLSFFAPWDGSALAALPALAFSGVIDWLAVRRIAKPLDGHLREQALQELAGVAPGRPAAGEPELPGLSAAPA
jgi:hypothetical protein